MSWDWELAWVVLLVLAGLLELAALIAKGNKDTLSYHMWKWFAVRFTNPDSKLVKVRRLLLLLIMAWLTVHFLTGGWV